MAFVSIETSYLLKGLNKSHSACRVDGHNLCKVLISVNMRLIDTKTNSNPLNSVQHESSASLNKVFAVVGMLSDHTNKLWHVVLYKPTL